MWKLFLFVVIWVKWIYMHTSAFWITHCIVVLFHTVSKFQRWLNWGRKVFISVFGFLAQTFPIVCFCLEIVREAVPPATPQIPQNRGVPNITATAPHKSFNSHITEQRKILSWSALSVLLGRRWRLQSSNSFANSSYFPPTLSAVRMYI